MIKNYHGEQWKPVKIAAENSNGLKLEVSNLGRVKSINKISVDGNILQGSMTEGYKVIRLKLFRKRDEKKQKELDNLKQQVLRAAAKLRAVQKNKQGKTAIADASARFNELKKLSSKKHEQDNKKRTIYYHALIHRLVATYFLPKPTKDQVVVGHLDHNKLNNRSANLKWMTADENYAHQKKSPAVIAEKKLRRLNGSSGTAKLNVTKVMLLKKLLNQDKPVRQLAKQFKVTDTQIIRIRKGENWGNIKAAK